MRTGVNTITLLNLASGVRFLVCRSWDGKMAVYAERCDGTMRSTCGPTRLPHVARKLENVSRGLSPVRLYQPGGN